MVQTMQIPKKYRKDGIAAYQTLPEAQALADEMTAQSGLVHKVTVDDKRGIAVVRVTGESAVKAADALHKDEYRYGDADFDEINQSGGGSLSVLEISVESKYTDTAYINGDLENAVAELFKKQEIPCYAIAVPHKDNQAVIARFEAQEGRKHKQNQDKQSFTLKYLVFLKKSVNMDADGNPFVLGEEYYDEDNRLWVAKRVDYDSFITPFGKGSTRVVLCVYFTEKNGSATTYANNDSEFAIQKLFKKTLWSKKELRRCRRRIEGESGVPHILVACAAAFSVLVALVAVGFLAYGIGRTFWDTKREIPVMCEPCSNLDYPDAQGNCYKLTDADGKTMTFRTGSYRYTVPQGEITVIMRTNCFTHETTVMHEYVSGAYHELYRID